MTDKRLEAAAIALATKNFELHGPKGATWDNCAGYIRDGFRLEAAKFLAVIDAVTPPDKRWTPPAPKTRAASGEA